MKRRILSVICALAVAISYMSNIAFAATDSNSISALNAPVITEAQAVLVKDGIVHVISSEEAQALKSQIEEIPVAQSPSNTTRANGYKFNVNSSRKYYRDDLYARVSQVVESPGQITTGFAYTYSAEYSFQAGLTATTSVIEAISAAITLVESASTQTNYSFSFAVPTGKFGAVYFTPMYRESTGIMEEFKNWGYSTYSATVYDPVKLGSFADGLYELVTATNRDYFLDN